MSHAERPFHDGDRHSGEEKAGFHRCGDDQAAQEVGIRRDVAIVAEPQHEPEHTHIVSQPDRKPGALAHVGYFSSPTAVYLHFLARGDTQTQGAREDIRQR